MVITITKNLLKNVIMKKFKKVIAGMANRENDNSIAAYLNFLTSKIPILEVLNFHFFTTKYLYDHLNKSDANLGDELLKRIEIRMGQNLEAIYTAIPIVNNHVRLGDAFRTMKSEINDTGADLIALGKLKNTHGTMAKNIMRFVECNILVIPEGASHSLTNILVPVDLSEHSEKILKAAIDLQKSMGNEIKITCLHASNSFDLTHYYLDLIGTEYEDEDATETELEFDEFVKKNINGNIAKIEKVLIKKVINSPSQTILDYIDANEVDLVIMGTKSHTSIDAFLGSTAEKVISKNDKVPILVLK